MRASHRLASGLAAAVLSLSFAGASYAAAPKYVLPEASRAVEGGRAVQVLVGQGEIKSNINTSNVSAATGGGLLGALIDAGIEAERAKKADAAIQPVLAALTGYDVDALAVAATKAAGEKLTWLQPTSEGFNRDTSVPGKSAMLDAGAASQTAFFEYVYDLSPDFSSVRVALTIQIADKAVPEGKKAEARLQPKNLVYVQSVTSVVSLPNPSADIGENADRWAADDGKLARLGLVQAFEQVGRLTPRAMELTEADVKVMNGKDKKRVTLAGYFGRLQEEGPEGSLLYTGGLVNVRPLAE